MKFAQVTTVAQDASSPTETKDHYEVYRGVEIYISARLIDMLKEYDMDAIQETHEEVEFELEMLEKEKEKKL